MLVERSARTLDWPTCPSARADGRASGRARARSSSTAIARASATASSSSRACTRRSACGLTPRASARPVDRSLLEVDALARRAPRRTRAAGAPAPARPRPRAARSGGARAAARAPPARAGGGARAAWRRRCAARRRRAARRRSANLPSFFGEGVVERRQLTLRDFADLDLEALVPGRLALGALAAAALEVRPTGPAGQPGRRQAQLLPDAGVADLEGHRLRLALGSARAAATSGISRISPLNAVAARRRRGRRLPTRRRGAAGRRACVSISSSARPRSSSGRLKSAVLPSSIVGPHLDGRGEVSACAGLEVDVARRCGGSSGSSWLSACAWLPVARHQPLEHFLLDLLANRCGRWRPAPCPVRKPGMRAFLPYSLDDALGLGVTAGAGTSIFSSLRQGPTSAIGTDDAHRNLPRGSCGWCERGDSNPQPVSGTRS